MDNAKMEKKLERELNKLGVNLNKGDIDPKDVQNIMKEVYDGIGKDMPSEEDTQKKADLMETLGLNNLNQKVKTEDDPKARAERLAQAKVYFQEGQKLAQQAVTSDGELCYGTAAVKYNKALESFAKSLSFGFPRGDDKRKVLVDTMEGYLDRMQDIVINFGDKTLTLRTSTEEMPATNELNGERRMVLESMTSCGFQCLSRGVKLRKQAQEYEAKEGYFEAFVLYQESLDCFMTYNGTDKARENKEASSKIMKIVLGMLDKAESLKKRL